jgi:hypothetical protein
MPPIGAVAQGSVVHALHRPHASHGRALIGLRTGTMACAVSAAMATVDLRQNLLGRLEGEVMQEHHDLLPVGSQVRGERTISGAASNCISWVGTWLCIQWVPGRASKS